ncbi:DUF6577 family protein [Flagellimonas marinaquae]|uniref:DUF6577 family protein n=1 Tax=Flagellimonas marinaquae TaxID=254955 RepID=UPI000F8D8BFD|nr:DUF6577 family protein [Allomuricauda aquimarina]
MYSEIQHRIEDYFTKTNTLTKEELVSKILSDFPELKLSTINVYLSKLKKAKIIKNPSRGLYSLSNKNLYKPDVDTNLKRLYNKIKKEYPYTEVCVWNTKWLNEFMRHQIFRFYTVLEVDKEATEAIFYVLKEEGRQVFLEPNAEIYNLYITNNYDIVIVRPLISEAPLSILENVTVPTLEKLLVDMTIDIELFGPQRAEIELIYQNAFQKYQLNINKMNRYALRRNRENEVNRLLNLTLAKK